MHQYLKSIGFEEIQTRKELKELLAETKNTFTDQMIISYQGESDFCEYRKEYGDRIGMILCGEMDEEESFETEYYVPYMEGEGVSTYADVTIEHRMDKEAYVGICEDEKVGISLIFHIKNGVEYMKEARLRTAFAQEVTVTFSALANEGRILFPVKKVERAAENKVEEQNNRKRLLNAARNGDQSAIETLTLDDIDTYSKVSRRLVTEDVLSIVDTYIMPYGVECDQYAILGVILELEKMQNWKTGKELYRMRLDVNELIFDLCVPVDQLLGEPAVGRRFKGNIWLQGRLNF